MGIVKIIVIIAIINIVRTARIKCYIGFLFINIWSRVGTNWSTKYLRSYTIDGIHIVFAYTKRKGNQGSPLDPSFLREEFNEFIQYKHYYCFYCILLVSLCFILYYIICLLIASVLLWTRYNSIQTYVFFRYIIKCVLYGE